MGKMVLVGKKITRLLFVLIAVSAISFLMINLLPGDVAYVIGGEDSTPEDIQAIREAFGLDRNMIVRYFAWLFDILRGDFGNSYLTREPVLKVNRLAFANHHRAYPNITNYGARSGHTGRGFMRPSK